jgi:predicted glycoside hydrolase/deacetylase ChbG (UPF0249 family)
MKLVITVDDCGVHPAVARAAARLAASGLATSACIVANGPYVEGAARLDGLHLGIGLDILRGRPVGHWQERASLVDERGMFLGSATRLFARYSAGDLRHDQVEAEWRAQIERVIDLGVRPTHLSSHANVHAWPTLTRVAGDLAARYGIGWLRTPDECAEVSRLDLSAYRVKFLNVCGLFSRSTPGVAWPALAWPALTWNDPAERGGFFPDRFAERVRNAADTLGPDAVVELCCRPGLTVAGDPPIDAAYDPTVISAIWQEQLASLSGPGWREVFDELGLEPVGFGDLRRPGG